jgi:5-(carboxyamino)imidazole ribonucleotide mutase
MNGKCFIMPLVIRQTFELRHLARKRDTMSKKMKQVPPVAVLMGSDSDWDTVRETVETLKWFGVDCDVEVISAHRTPQRASAFAGKAAGRGTQVIVAAAGGAAHLAGVLAAHTTLPVIGIPIKGGALDGLDALLSTVQMPAGVPVATVALGKAGAINAALLAVQILALNRADLRKKLAEHKSRLKKKVDEGNKRLSAQRGAKK